MDFRTISVAFTLNGKPVTATVPEHWSLLHALREGLFAYEVKDGCSQGDCGTCAVLLDGVAVNSCLVPVGQAEGCEVVTVKGVGNDPGTAPLLDAFVHNGGVQCGYCTPGMVVAGAELLKENPNPTREEIRESISGNLCRCTGYTKIVDSIAAAAKVVAEREEGGA
ncbi:MAG TPA: (2Fe-2S)-binding protein [Symbiobacteriaceae bacterium]|nr:(2Fe-2S)-binding protein [Symbiobacteriaceae bacterium]